ncbi:helix-turn-helix domain-containing protein [Nocardia terpenica]|uniref:DUF2637 domain-containing protein n=1 Tax=Nocardia terpenica TaxID=455432 RepID=A0A164PLM3_9NOCA|nr:helix-turn-helix domain-containing protein [Nocardia terpenica]KZM75731.1 hypothetical protein AWN90_20555 [Nocardia terpenica]NQE86246.1 helix-turn-helix domain-containing protein [Nocardia terpenica]
MHSRAVIASRGARLICALAFASSFTASSDMAARSGISLPMTYPLVVDGLIVVATIALDELRGWAAAYAWFLLGTSTALAMWVTGTHVFLSPDAAIPTQLRVAMAITAPIAMLAATHLAMMLRHNASSATTDPKPENAATPAPEEFDAPDPAMDVVHNPSLSPLSHLRRVGDATSPTTVDADDAAPDGTSDARARAVTFIRDTDWSNYRIAREVGRSEATVRRWRHAERATASV